MSVTQETLGVSTESDRPDDCECGREGLEAMSNEYVDLERVELTACWPCFRAGFRTVNPEADSDE